MNRGISLISYNLLKLPQTLTISSRTVSYSYSASGQKLRMSNSAPAQVRDYIGPFQYLNGILFEVSHGEGRVAVDAAGNYRYEYFHRDHLGNIRAVYRDSLTGPSGGVYNPPVVVQRTDYDAWGVVLSGVSSGTSTNRLRFNGQESLSEIGSGVLDFDTRLYDAPIGRTVKRGGVAPYLSYTTPFLYTPAISSVSEF